MEMIMNCFFDDVFSQLDRGYLLTRYKRKELIDYLSNVIKACYTAEESDPQQVCEKAILSALRFHATTRNSNAAICLMGKFHNVLYIAAKLCYDFRVDNSDTVSRLLYHMFMCEQSFERLFTGVIYGLRVSYLLAGWKTDFESRKENLEAITYFMDHATKSRSEFILNDTGEPKRFVEVPLMSYGKISPAGACLLTGHPDMLLILLRFGAPIDASGNFFKPPPCFQLLSKLNDYHMKGAEPPIVMKQCLTLLLRVVPTVQTLLHDETLPQECLTIEPEFIEKYIPDTRSGKTTPELKHLCRLVVRDTLNRNFQLPYGIDKLPVPDVIRDYINITHD